MSLLGLSFDSFSERHSRRRSTELITASLRLERWARPPPALFASLHIFDSIDHQPGNSRNDLALVRMLGSKGDEHKLRTIRQLKICGIVSGGTRPAGF